MYRRFSLGLLLGLIGLGVVFVEHRPTEEHRSTFPNAIVQFASSGHVVGFTTDSYYVAAASHVLHVEFVGQHRSQPLRDATPAGSEKEATSSKIQYSNLWEGITISYDAPNGAIARSTYRIAPGANVDAIRLRYNAPVSLRPNGDLRIDFKSGWMTESAPLAWQERSGQRVPVDVAFALCSQQEVGFTLGDYDRASPLFIDPTLTWSTFLGGAGSDELFGLTLDALGNVYVAGFSTQAWGSPVQAYSGGVDGFVAKLDSSGNIVWTTFLGGAGTDEAIGVAVDLVGNIYVTGFSDATWGTPVQPFGAGEFENFTAKLDPNGNLIWNTFLGSAETFQNVSGRSVAVDVVGNVYVTGRSSSDWGSPIRPLSGGSFDAFVAKLDSNGVLVWNTFVGSTGMDEGNAIAVDATGNVYFSGDSDGSWGSPVRSFSGSIDGFVAKLDSNGQLIWNTFLGGNLGDQVNGMTLDATGNVYAVGSSSSTWGSPVMPFSSGLAIFAAKLDSNGQLIWNTFLGNGGDTASAVALDLSGNIYLAGISQESWGSPDRAFGGGFDTFVAALDPSGNLIWNTFLGGNANDFGFGIGVDSTGNVYVGGYSQGAWGSPVRAYTASEDAFVAKLAPSAGPTPTPTPTPSPTPTPTPSPTPTPTPTPTPGCQFSATITANFNGTMIRSGSYIWFNSVLKPSGLGSTPVTFLFTQQMITSANFAVMVPDAMVTFDPVATSATTTFIGGMWVTRVPSSGLAGNTFLAGVVFQVPAGIPGGLKNVQWSGTIIPDTPRTSLHWKWAAAVYTLFSSDYNLLGVKPVDDNKASQYKNSDAAGTPENFKPSVIDGATGGGGANYTGGYSGTAQVGACSQ